MQIKFLLGSMDPKQAAKTMADDIAQHIRTLCDNADEGQVSMAKDIVAFIESIEVVETALFHKGGTRR